MFCDSERKNFGLKQENFFCRIAKTTIEVSVGTFSGIFSNIFSSFFNFRQGHRNLHSRCQNDHFEEFVFDFFFIIFGHWAENQLLLVEKLWQCCYICVLRVQKDILTKISFSSRNCFLEHFWTRDKFTPVFWQKLFDNVVKTSFSVSIGNFRGIKCLKKKSFFFSVVLGQGAKKLSARGEVISARLSKLQSTCPKKSFWEIFFFRKNENFLNVSWQWVKNHRHLARIFFAAGMSKLQSKFLQEQFVFFSNLTPSSFIDGPWAKEPGIMAKTIRHVCWYCILHVHRYCLRKKTRFFLNLSGTLGRRVRKSSACVIIFPAEMPEVLFRFTHKVSKENLSFKKMVFAISFGHWVKNVWPSIKHFSAMLSKCAF